MLLNIRIVLYGFLTSFMSVLYLVMHILCVYVLKLLSGSFGTICGFFG